MELHFCNDGERRQVVEPRSNLLRIMKELLKCTVRWHIPPCYQKIIKKTINNGKLSIFCYIFECILCNIFWIIQWTCVFLFSWCHNILSIELFYFHFFPNDSQDQVFSSKLLSKSGIFCYLKDSRNSWKFRHFLPRSSKKPARIMHCLPRSCRWNSTVSCRKVRQSG